MQNSCREKIESVNLMDECSERGRVRKRGNRVDSGGVGR